MNPAQVSDLPPEGGYPIQLGVTTDRTMSRLWGIPLIGLMVRWFLCIPHFVVLWVISIVTGLWMLLGWIYILLFGRVPAFLITVVTESMQRQSRVLGYVFFMMPSEYPPLEPGPSKPINVQLMPRTLEINRWWGIPLIGLFVRFLCLLPHLIIASILWTVAVLAWLIVWIPVLLFGRYPNWAASYFGLTLRYTLRIGGWMMFLPIPYPPILPD